MYKTKLPFKNYKVGEVVSEEDAKQFLSQYAKFEHQDILEYVENIKEEKPVASKPTTKKTTKKAIKKK